MKDEDLNTTDQGFRYPGCVWSLLCSVRYPGPMLTFFVVLRISFHYHLGGGISSALIPRCFVHTCIPLSLAVRPPATPGGGSSVVYFGCSISLVNFRLFVSLMCLAPMVCVGLRGKIRDKILDVTQGRWNSCICVGPLRRRMGILRHCRS